MQYSYERWLDEEPKTAEPPEESAEQPPKAFPFAEDLKALEQDLSLGLEEGLQTYRLQQVPPQAGLWQSPGSPSAEEAHWDDLAKLVADHVLAYMLDNPLQDELQDLRVRNKAYYQDNRAMAEQVRTLVDENESLRKALRQVEQELAAFQKLAGRFYVKP